MARRSGPVRLLLALTLAVAQVLARPATPIQAQTAPRLSGTAQCFAGTSPTVLPNAAVTVFSGSVQVASTTADANAGWSVPGSAPNSVYIVRYQSATSALSCGVTLTTDANGSAIAPAANGCPTTERNNRTWLKAAALQITATSTVTLTDSLCKPRQSRWYKVPIFPGQRVTAEITDVSFDATLSLFRDIRATADKLKPPAGGQLSLPDVQNITASLPHKLVAPDETAPDETAGDSFFQDVTAPDETAPDETAPDETAPDETAPDFATPDETAPDETAPDETAPDLYSIAQTRSIIAYSDKPGRSPELVRRHTWDNSGFFYIRVHGHNGAFDDTTPYTLKVALENRHCTDGEGGRVGLTVTPPSFNGGVPTPRTLILTNTARFPVGSDIAGLLTSLNGFASRAEIGGLVFDLATDKGLQQDYAQWDNPAFQDCVPAANIVVDQIHRIEELVRAQSPNNLQYVVLVGSDHVIPFKRIPDEAGLGSEKDYSPAVLDGSATQASLKSDYFLSQDVYGSFQNVSRLDHELSSFDIAVGRMVENPPEIRAQLNAYAATNGVIQPNTALVTGYDFLSPAAALQRDDLGASLSSVDATLIQPVGDGPNATTAWHDTDLRNKLFGQGQVGYDIIALNAHFSGNTLLAADEATRVKSRELSVVNDNRFQNTIWFSMGCHSGFNITDAEATQGTQPIDWAQAIAMQGGWLIGGSGYQYGNTPFIKYSEVLLAGMVHELRLFDGDIPGPVSLGQALINTKRNYIHQGMSGIDEKAVGELTLYGLPMLGVNLGSGRIPRPSDGLVQPAPGVSPGLSKTDLTPNYTLTRHDQTLLKAHTDGQTTTATYFDASSSGVTDVQSTPMQPILPQLVSNVAAAGAVARSAILWSSNYTDVTGIRPLIDAPATENRLVRPVQSASIFSPAQLLELNDLNGQSLAIRPFQFRSAGQSVHGTGRTYSDLVTRVYYSNRTDSSALAGPPVIYNTRLTPAEGGLNVETTIGGPIRMTDSGGVPDLEEVIATYTAERFPDGPTQSLYGRWSSKLLTLKPGTLKTNSVGFSEQLTGFIPLSFNDDPSLVRVIIQAVGGNAAVSTTTNNGAGYRFVRETATLGNPKVATKLRLQPEGGSPYTADYRTTLSVAAKLTNQVTGAVLSGRPVTFSLGRARVSATTDANGLASASLPVVFAPGGFPIPQVLVGFDEDPNFLASGDSRDVFVNRENTRFLQSAASIQYGNSADIATLVAQVAGGGSVLLREVGVRITLNDGRVVDTQTDGFGRVLFDTLDFEGVQPGSYPTQLNYFGSDRYMPSFLQLTQTVTAVNRSLAVDGNTGFAEAPGTADLNLLGDWTVETWFKDEDPSGFDHDWAYLVSKGDRRLSKEIPYFVGIFNGLLFAGDSSTHHENKVYYDLDGNGVDPTAWHHVAASLQASTRTLTLYLDGVQVVQQVLPSVTMTGNALPVELGRNGPVEGKNFTGKLDDVRVWNLMRSASDIQNNYRIELPGAAPAGLVANWKFNEKIGTLLAFSSSDAPQGTKHTAVVSTSGAAFSNDVHP